MWGKERNCGIGTGPVSKRLELGGRDRNWGGGKRQKLLERDKSCGWRELLKGQCIPRISIF